MSTGATSLGRSGARSGGSGRSGRWSVAAKWVLSLGILGALLGLTGMGPFVAGISSLDGWTVVLGAGIAVVTTVACAWRWRLVAAGLGVGVALPTAVASCYRAQLLNSVLPGGVLGDVHRGVRHGQDVGDTGRALRAVAWERLAGQVVHLGIAAALLLALPAPWGAVLPAVGPAPGSVALLVAALAAGLVAVIARGSRRGGRRQGRGPGRMGSVWVGPVWVGRVLRAVRDDVRVGLLVRRAWPGIVLGSAVATAGHLVTFLLAARAVGVTAPPATLIPLAVLVLVAAALPLNLAGWGPREGMAAWVFAASGLSASQGIATAVAYGALVLLANAPGAAVLLLSSTKGRRGRHLVLRPEVVAAGGLHG